MTEWLDWPFFEDRHRALYSRLRRWCADQGGEPHDDDIDGHCRSLVRSLGDAGLLELCVAKGELLPDVRSLALARLSLAATSGLADFAFAMQGLGSGAISIAGSADQKAEWLPLVSSGEAIAAFALTEPDTGSDAANIGLRAEKGADGWRLSGKKTYISNGTIADVLTVFARTGTAEEGARGISAFIVRGDDPGLSIEERIEVIAPHPLARLGFREARAELLGKEGEGFRLAMQTLNLFRVTVGGAALGFAVRAMEEAIRFAGARRLGGGVLADNPVTQERIAEMALAVDASALLIARARGQPPRGRHGQAPRHRGGAEGDRHGGADARGPRGYERLQGRGALSRDQGASHL